MGRDLWWSVPAAVVLGIPMYSNAAGIIPVVQAPIGKGAALGTMLAFMMAVIALSAPEMIILRKVLKPRLIGVFADCRRGRHPVGGLRFQCCVLNESRSIVKMKEIKILGAGVRTVAKHTHWLKRSRGKKGAP